MNEELLESANLYALGLLTDSARDAFEQELRRNPALQKEVHAFQEAALALAASAPAVAPPPDLRAELIAAFATKSQAASPSKAMTEAGTDNIIPITAAASSRTAAPPPSSGLKILHFIPWAAAAAMAFVFYQDRQAIQTAQQSAAAAQASEALAREREKQFSEAARTQAEATLSSLRERLTKAESSLASISQEKEKLVAEVSRLRSDSELDRTRIAVLGSLLKDQPQAVAVSLWRQNQQDGLLVVENMPALPAGRDYQLWVIDPNLKTPVSAGVFKVDTNGKVRLEFKPVRPVQSAFKFAVTVEQEGGADMPTMDTMVVIGG
jgi:anti-sigma-K factor RskA